jgi:uncharacterized coiled-coil DUF342 family protein
VAAQNQKIEYLFAAQVTGQNELKKLTSAVDSLRKEMDALRAANGPLATGMGAVEGAARKSGKGLDEASKAIRNHRQGVQQAGMQLNDFATSVSTGASPIQAFNQQIGQLGYAMSMMGGVAGKIGNFLAGPWSILVIGAAMVIGFLIEKFTAASAAASELQVASSSLSSAQSALGDMFDTSTGKIKSNTTETRINTLAKIANLRVTAAEASARAKAQFTKIIDPGVIERAKTIGGDALNAIYDPKAGFLPAVFNEGYLANLQSGRKDVQATFAVAEALFTELKSGSKTAGKELENLFQKGDPKLQQYIVDMNTAASYLDAAKEAQGSFDSGSLAAGLLKPDNKRERKPKVVSETDKLRAAQKALVEEFELGNLTLAEFETKLVAVTDKFGDAKNPAEDYLKQFKEANDNVEKFKKSTNDLTTKALPDYISKLRDLEAQYENIQKSEKMTGDLQIGFMNAIKATAAGPIDTLIKKYENLHTGMTQFEQDQAAAKAVLDALSAETGEAAGVGADAASAAIGRLTKAMDDARIREKNEEIKNSFEAIGNSVSEAFKGMLTGAMSWKDGMRSLIGSVIDQLWKLFVVQKIVGLITGAFGGATASPNAASASGNIGMSSPGKFMPLTLRAFGGSVAGNTPYMVGERGPELFVPGGNGTIIPNGNMRGGGGGGSPISINVDARGSSDPAAVRAQVQQGILEAAPAIIAAAESRTIAGLRRPRLGGVMQ